MENQTLCPDGGELDQLLGGWFLFSHAAISHILISLPVVRGTAHSEVCARRARDIAGEIFKQGRIALGFPHNPRIVLSS